MKQDPYELAIIIENLIDARITENESSHFPKTPKPQSIYAKLKLEI